MDVTSSAAAEPARQGEGPPPAVLLVDDRPENLLALEAALAPLGLEVVRAGSPAAALRLAAEREFAVILLDVQMPGMDGYEVARRIKGMEGRQLTPIIFVTALDRDRRHLHSGYASGAVDYLFKPLDPDTLRAKVQAFVHLHEVREAEVWREREAAHESERARLVEVFQQAPVAVVVVRGRVAADLTFELVNPRYVEMLPPGRAPLGRTVREVLPEATPELLAALQGVLDTGEPFVATDHCVPLDRDGDGRPEDYYFNFVYHPLREGGAVVGVVGIGTEVTDSVRARRRAEELAERLRASEASLREQAHQLETITRNASLALFIMDERQRCTYMNPAAERLTGFTLAELQGKPLHYHVHHTRPDGSPYPLEECPIDRALPQNMRERGEEVFVHRDGSFYEVAFTASPIRQDGRAVGTVVEVRDIREEKARDRERARLLAAERAARAEAEVSRRNAVEASQAKSAFLATMSHELRTPINAIIGYAQLVDLGIAGPLTEQQREYLARLTRSSEHLLALVNDVLDISKIEAGELSARREGGWTATAVDAALDLARPLADARRIAIDDERPDAQGVPYVGDEQRVRQILVNLLSNAVKFTEPGGRIVVACGTAPEASPAARVHGRGPWAWLRVADTGIGIASGQLARIFEPFTQLDSGHTRKQGGTGLGLAISRRLARLMGGDLVAESEAGRGSVFTLWLPAASPTAGDAGGAESAAARRTRAEAGGSAAGAGIDAPGLDEIGEALRASTEEILDGYVERLRRDPALPESRALSRPELEDHHVTLLADLTQSLVIIGAAGADARTLLRDGSAIQRTISEHHGARRRQQGWSESSLRRGYDILREEVARAVGRQLRAGGAARQPQDADAATRVLLSLIDKAEAESLRAWRRAGGDGGEG